MKKILATLASTLSLMGFGVLFLANPASGAVLWDYSPDTTGARIVETSWSNYSDSQNFLEMVSFDKPVFINGMDIYSHFSFNNLGRSVIVKVFSDISGEPGSLLDKFIEKIDAVDSQGTSRLPILTRKHADFVLPLSLMAGTYWVGMSAADFSPFAQAGLLNVQDNSMWKLQGDELITKPTYIGDMAFRLEGETIPEPINVALFGASLAGLSLIRRKRM